ncbi:hypothetical protein BN435_2595 [Erwinia amylovora 01SFR-BO]|nr:hypothetical protein BN432_2607 [Erwinia amylovora Ea356]CCO86951.1 hypothetical protein BN434_2580 [Erwinia amylovora CFBP 2585]CCO90747.1 hypothetical protein BN435_2595 [Erwinia amylovora 01SFR-BO]CCO99859.1 hypothetical protein BN438_2594 [Erwinia amylovora UPN527]
MPAAEAAQRGAEFSAEVNGRGRAEVALLRRSRPVGGQRQQVRRTVQLLIPVVGLLRQAFRGEEPALPGGIVGELQRQRRQHGGASGAAGVIAGAQFAPHHPDRPAVGDDVVLGDQQAAAVVGQPYEAGAHQRTARQGEGLMGFLRAEPLQLRLMVGVVAQVVVHQRRRGVRRQQAGEGLAVLLAEGHAPGLVAGEEVAEGEVQGAGVEVAVQRHGGGHVVGGGVLLKLPEEPQALLGKGERQRSVAVGADKCGQGVTRSGADGGGHLCQQRVGENLLYRQRAVVQLAQTAAEPDRQQGVAAEGEEVIAATDAADAEQFAPQVGEELFGVALRRFEVGAGKGVVVGDGQCAAVKLAVGGEGKGVEGEPGGGQHVVGQTPGKEGAQRGGGGGVVRAQRDNVSHEARFGAGALLCGDGGLAYVGVLTEACGDFARLDAEAADFDLVIVAAEVNQAAVILIAGEVAGAVHARAGQRAERVIKEAFGGQFRTVQVAARHPGTANPDLTYRSWRHLLSGFIQQVDSGIGYRATYGLAYRSVPRIAVPG